jgi:hypothetical protein
MDQTKTEVQPDLAHVIMEQAMKHGRCIMFKAADAMVEGPPGKAMPQMVHIEMRPALNKPGITSIVPTHAVNGRLLQDKDWMHFITKMGEDLTKAEG